MELQWTINKGEVLSKAGETQVISSVEWQLTARDGEKYAERKGTQQLDTTNLDGFTSFVDVTQSQLATWVQDAMGDRYNDLKLDLIRELDHTMTDINNEDIG
tara:strand:- start:342 stop:647 length:306 start_codon:yes stop_codon:yes gene_type:complete